MFYCPGRIGSLGHFLFAFFFYSDLPRVVLLLFRPSNPRLPPDWLAEVQAHDHLRGLGLRHHLGPTLVGERGAGNADDAVRLWRGHIYGSCLLHIHLCKGYCDLPDRTFNNFRTLESLIRCFCTTTLLNYQSVCNWRYPRRSMPKSPASLGLPHWSESFCPDSSPSSWCPSMSSTTTSWTSFPWPRSARRLSSVSFCPRSRPQFTFTGLEESNVTRIFFQERAATHAKTRNNCYKLS